MTETTKQKEVSIFSREQEDCLPTETVDLVNKIIQNEETIIQAAEREYKDGGPVGQKKITKHLVAVRRLKKKEGKKERWIGIPIHPARRGGKLIIVGANEDKSEAETECIDHRKTYGQMEGGLATYNINVNFEMVKQRNLSLGAALNEVQGRILEFTEAAKQLTMAVGSLLQQDENNIQTKKSSNKQDKSKK